MPGPGARRVVVGAHVEEVVVEGGRAVGVRLRTGEEIRATKAVISNAVRTVDTNPKPCQ